MPINFSDMTVTTPWGESASFDAKFFDSRITGRGGQKGLLCEGADPRHARGTRTTKAHLECERHSELNGNIEVKFDPLYVLSPSQWALMREWPSPDPSAMCRVADLPHGRGTVYASMHVHTMHRTEENPGKVGESHAKTVTACYRVQLFALPDGAGERTPSLLCGSVDAMLAAVSPATATDPARGGLGMTFSCDPATVLERWAEQLRSKGCKTDDIAVKAFVDGYSLYDGVVDRSRVWQTKVADVANEFLTQTADAVRAGDQRAVEQISALFAHLESYDVDLKCYEAMFGRMRSLLPAQTMTRMCRLNVNMLLLQTLSEIGSDKTTLMQLPPEDPIHPVHLTHFEDARGNMLPYSAEQRVAIETREPLTLVQAGAGSGKSSVILARIKYMQMLGIPLSQITMISFTNAAADHIAEENPGIHSITIASMMNQIYETNFPTHQLSGTGTLMNSLSVYMPNDPFARRLVIRLRNLSLKKQGAFAALNRFVEGNLNDVIRTLNVVRQTTLELQTIICYLCIDSLREPPNIITRYLIMDEVQDTSLFEFIYALRYVAKHRGNLFIVGDCSQTLYEFRNSDPRALNTLERSGAFACYKLETNYRSNQDILDFANVLLRDIEANRNAKIQLRANMMARPTIQSFTSHVRVRYQRLDRKPRINNANDPQIQKMLRDNIIPYVTEKLDAGERVAILAHRRVIVFAAEKAVQDLLARRNRGEVLKNLAPDKTHESSALSKFLTMHWDSTQFLPTADLARSVSRAIMANASTIMPSVKNPGERADICRRICDRWLQTWGGAVTQWHNQYMRGAMTLDDLLENVRRSLLDFEIKSNAMSQRIRGIANQNKKSQQGRPPANVEVCTIHSAKGLQFDNVVVIWEVEGSLMSEPDKRMYYVSLTRAQHTELVYAFGTQPNPNVEANYKEIVNELREREAKARADAMIAETARRIELREAGSHADATPGQADAQAALAALPPQTAETKDETDKIVA